MKSVESSYQQRVLMEEDQRCVLIIGGIQIFLQNSPAEANTSVSHEEVVQQEYNKEAWSQMLLNITMSVMQV
jgi:hypothetical protein